MIRSKLVERALANMLLDGFKPGVGNGLGDLRSDQYVVFNDQNPRQVHVGSLTKSNCGQEGPFRTLPKKSLVSHAVELAMIRTPITVGSDASSLTSNSEHTRNEVKATPWTMPLVLFLALSASETALAACNISDAKLEEAILQKPELRDSANRQVVLDLRALREAALILWSYGRTEDCERMLGNIREMIASPGLGSAGDNDEDEIDQQMAAEVPMTHKGGQEQGRRGDPGETPLIGVSDLEPALRADEFMGAEVRSSDDKIIGEVRNIIIGTKARANYAIVASGGFFLPGKESIVVPLPFMQVNEERNSFFLRISEAEMRKVPLMPDQDYDWLADRAWLANNDAVFRNLVSSSPSVE